MKVPETDKIIIRFVEKETQEEVLEKQAWTVIAEYADKGTHSEQDVLKAICRVLLKDTVYDKGNR